MLPVIIGTTFLIFIMVWALPGDPFAGRCGQRPCSAAFIQGETARLHLDQSLPVQYGYFIWNMLHGDFGTVSNGDTVLHQILRAYPITIKLTTVAILFEIVFGIGFGIIAALRRGKTFDNVTLFFSLVAISFPVFVIGFV